MKSLFRIFTATLFVSGITTSCVSNYVVSNSNYKYPSTNELLVYSHKPYKGPNAIKAPEKTLVTEKTLDDKALLDDVSVYAEKEFSKAAQNLIVEAKTYLGTPYRYGGTTRNGIDCSSFVQHVFNAFDISLPRTSAMQSQKGTWVSKENLKKGDLIFFAHTPKSRISHVGIVESVSPTGEIFFIHASSSKGVTVSSLDMAYWKIRFRSGKRILQEDNFELVKMEEGINDDKNLVKLSY